MDSSTLLTSTVKPFTPPLLYDPKTNEPYLPLPPPLGPRIRLTPPRMATTGSLLQEPNDIAALVHLLNMPEIYMNLTGPPFPYTEGHAVMWLTARKLECEKVLEEMEERHRDGGALVGGFPVRILREKLDDGTDVFIGDVHAGRSVFHEIKDPDERQRRIEENTRYPDGSPEIIYAFGGPSQVL